MTIPGFEVQKFPEEYRRAHDGSQVRELPRLPQASLAHCTLEAGRTSLAIAHRTVSEIWHFTEGQGQVWLKQDTDEKVVDVSPGLSLTIPVGTHFQFRATGDGPLCFLSVSTPKWPGSGEVYYVADYWPTNNEQV